MIEGHIGPQIQSAAQLFLQLDLLMLELVQLEHFRRGMSALVRPMVMLLGEGRQCQHMKADKKAGIRINRSGAYGRHRPYLYGEVHWNFKDVQRLAAGIERWLIIMKRPAAIVQAHSLYGVGRQGGERRLVQMLGELTGEQCMIVLGDEYVSAFGVTTNHDSSS